MQNTYLVDGELVVVDDLPRLVGSKYISEGFNGLGVFTWTNSQRDSYPFKLGNLIATTSPSLSGVDKFDWPGEVDAEALVIDYGDNLRKEARDWHKGQHVGLPMTSKEINARVDGFISGYKAAPKKEYSASDMYDCVLEFYYYCYNGKIYNKDMQAELNEWLPKHLSSLRPIPTYIEFELEKVNGKLIVKNVKY